MKQLTVLLSVLVGLLAPVQTLVCCALAFVCIDFVTGVVASRVRARRQRARWAFESAKAWQTVYKIVLVTVGIALTWLIDRFVLPFAELHLANLFTGFVCGVELWSYLENAAELSRASETDETKDRQPAKPSRTMILENQVSSPFAAKVRQIASRLGVPPDYLMAVMWSESRLDPAATNPEGGATGLIQFMPATAAGLGTSCEALREMSALDQLDYVERFFRPYAPRCHTFGDFYMACFFPAAIGKEDDYVLQTRKLSAERIARQNPAFDTDRDGRITAGEFRRRLPKLFPDEFRSILF